MNGSFSARLLALALFSGLMLALEPTAKAAAQIKPVYVELPEIIVALNHEYQAVVQMTVRLADSSAEKHVRENLPPLRHALVLHLSDINVDELTSQSLDALSADYVPVANHSLEVNNAVKSAFLQKFVVQTK